MLARVFIKFKITLLLVCLLFMGCADSIDVDGVNPAALKSSQQTTCPAYDSTFINEGLPTHQSTGKEAPEYLSSLLRHYLSRYDVRFGSDAFMTYPGNLTPEIRLSVNGTEGYLFFHLKKGGWRREKLVPIHCENGRMMLTSDYRENVYTARGTLVLRPEGKNLLITAYTKVKKRVAGIFSFTQAEMSYQWRFYQVDPEVKTSLIKIISAR